MKGQEGAAQDEGCRTCRSWLCLIKDWVVCRSIQYGIVKSGSQRYFVFQESNITRHGSGLQRIQVVENIICDSTRIKCISCLISISFDNCPHKRRLSERWGWRALCQLVASDTP
jgi:hypothetical protein